MKQREPESSGRPARRSKSRRGSETVEFTLVLLPLLAMLGGVVDTAWAVWAKSTLQQAVRLGVRTGVTLTAGQMVGGACLTDTVKGIVQSNAMGLLRGSSGLSKIKVNYIQPPAPNSNAAAVDVSALATADAPGNIMQVSVQGFSLVPLLPRITSWHGPVDTSPLIVTVYSADLIEPNRNPPCVGTAP